MDDNVTAQFNLLIRERDEFKNAAGIAERERRREEQILQGHRSAMHQVADQLRIAQSDDGEGTRKLQTLKDTKVRLAHQIESDRQEIVRVTNEMKGKDSEDKTQKWKFVSEMDSINDELDLLLTKEENENTLKLLDVDTVNWLVETKLFPLTNNVEGMDEDYIEAEHEKGRDIKTKIDDASTALREAQKKAAAVDQAEKELEIILQGLREQFMLDHGVSLVAYTVKFLIGFVFHFVPKRLSDIFSIEHW